MDQAQLIETETFSYLPSHGVVYPPPENMAKLAKLVEDGVITRKTAREEVLPEMIRHADACFNAVVA